MRDELLNETMFRNLAHARIVIAAGAAGYNTERPHSALATRPRLTMRGPGPPQSRHLAYFILIGEGLNYPTVADLGFVGVFLFLIAGLQEGLARNRLSVLAAAPIAIVPCGASQRLRATATLACGASATYPTGG